MSDSTLEYIRRYYGVPAYRDVRVQIEGKDGVIVRGAGDGAAYILVKLDGKRGILPYHPCDHVEYIIPERTCLRRVQP